jgi:hypothetical protein
MQVILQLFWIGLLITIATTVFSIVVWLGMMLVAGIITGISYLVRRLKGV